MLFENYVYTCKLYSSHRASPHYISIFNHHPSSFLLIQRICDKLIPSTKKKEHTNRIRDCTSFWKIYARARPRYNSLTIRFHTDESSGSHFAMRKIC